MPGNAYIAGICAYLHVPSREYPLTYYTQAQAGSKYWSKVAKVDLRPTWVLSLEDMKHLSATTTGAPHLDPAFPLTAKLLQQAEAQVETTLKHHLMPPQYEGQIHRYLLDPPDQPSFFRSGIPIIVHGTPVTIEEGLDRATTVTAIQSLYHTDQALVPIQPPHDEHRLKQHPVVANIAFSTHPQKRTSSWAIARSEAISMHYVLETDDDEEGRPQHLSIPFLFQGAPWDIRVSYVPGQVSKEDLVDAMALAYWNEDEAGDSWDDIKDSLSALDSHMRELVSADFDDPDQVFADSLRRYADRFIPRTPAPRAPVTATSHDGKLTLTYTP